MIEFTLHVRMYSFSIQVVCVCVHVYVRTWYCMLEDVYM